MLKNRCTGPSLSVGAGVWENKHLWSHWGTVSSKFSQTLKPTKPSGKPVKTTLDLFQNAFRPHLRILSENWLHLRGRRHNHSPVPPSAWRHTPHRFFRVMSSCPGYRSNLEEMGEKQSEKLDRARVSGRHQYTLSIISFNGGTKFGSPFHPLKCPLKTKWSNLPPFYF